MATKGYSTLTRFSEPESHYWMQLSVIPRTPLFNVTNLIHSALDTVGVFLSHQTGWKPFEGKDFEWYIFVRFGAKSITYSLINFLVVNIFSLNGSLQPLLSYILVTTKNCYWDDSWLSLKMNWLLWLTFPQK